MTKNAEEDMRTGYTFNCIKTLETKTEVLVKTQRKLTQDIYTICEL